MSVDEAMLVVSPLARTRLESASKIPLEGVLERAVVDLQIVFFVER